MAAPEASSETAFRADLVSTDQGVEAAAIEGVEDASDHPERPTDTHEEYGHPDHVPPKNRSEEAA